MLGAAVVPHRDRVRFPAEAEGPFGLGAVLDQEGEQVLALARRELLDADGEGFVDVEKLAPALGMADDDGVGRARRPLAEHADPVMQRGQPLQIRFHTLGQRVVGGVHAGEQGIAAAVGRQRVVVEDAGERRDRRAGLVGVPDIARDFFRILVEMEAPHAVVVRRLAVGPDADMVADGAEVFRQPRMVLEADLLVAEEQHQVFREGAAELAQRFRVERPGQVDIADLGADMGARRRDRYRPVGRPAMAVHGFRPGSGGQPTPAARLARCRRSGLFRRGA